MEDGLTVTLDDEATPWLARVTRDFPDLRRKAFKSLGWWMQGEIKAGIRSGAPGGVPYAPRRMGDLNRLRLKPKEQVSKTVLGKLVRAVGYQYLEGDSTAVVGWLSKSAVRLGTIAEEGKSIPVTPNMIRRFRKARVPLSPFKRTLSIPPRPTIGPMWRVLEPQVIPYLEGKFQEYLEAEGKPRTSKSRSRRTYRVLGRFFGAG